MVELEWSNERCREYYNFFNKLILFNNKNHKIFYTITYCKSNNNFYSFNRFIKKDEKLIQSYLFLNKSTKHFLDEANSPNNIGFEIGPTRFFLIKNNYISALAKVYDESKNKEKTKKFEGDINNLIHNIERRNFQDLRVGKEINVDKKQITKDLVDILGNLFH